MQICRLERVKTMTKIDIFSGFLGAGKTTLIKKLIAEAYAGEKLVLIENEFGETGIDGGFLKDSGVQINEMNSGCICCSLVGDFAKALSQVLDEYNPDRILIEPSGVGKLSDVIKAVNGAQGEKAVLGSTVTVVDANKCKMYVKNFGEFFIDQVENAQTVILSRTSNISGDKLASVVKLLHEHHHEHECCCHHDHHHDHNHDHHHDHNEDCECTCHEHHHHDHDEDCDCGCHEHHHEHEHEHECHHEHHEHHDEHGHHHHEHGEECRCGCHEHHDHDHHHHHADEVFSSWGTETVSKYTTEEIEKILCELDHAEEYGIVLRAKGIVALTDGNWAHFDYVPGEHNVRIGSAEITGKICVIGSGLKEEKLPALFKI